MTLNDLIGHLEDIRDEHPDTEITVGVEYFDPDRDPSEPNWYWKQAPCFRFVEKIRFVNEKRDTKNVILFSD